MDSPRSRTISTSPRPASVGMFIKSRNQRLEDIFSRERLRELDLSEEVADFDLLYSTDETLHEFIEQYQNPTRRNSLTGSKPMLSTVDSHISGYLNELSQLDARSSSAQFASHPFMCKLMGKDFGRKELHDVADLEAFIKDVMKLKSANSYKDLAPFWIDFQAPKLSDILILEKLFGVHPLTCRECVHTEAREKYEVLNGYLFIVLHEICPNEVVSWSNMVPVWIIIFPNLILTVHPVPLPSIADTMSMMQPDGNIYTSDRCLYTLLRNSTVGFEKRVGSVVFEAQNLDELTLVLFSSSSDSDDLLRRIQIASSQTSTLHWMMCTKQEIYLSLCILGLPALTRSTQVYLRSLLDSIVRMRLSLDIGREILDNSHANYLAMASVQNAQVSQRTDTLMKKLSSVSAILLPLTLIAGLFGMNVNVPGQSEPNLNWFIGICVLIGFIVVIMTAFFRRRGFL